MRMRSIARVVALTALTAAAGSSPAGPSEPPLRVVTVAGQAEVSKGNGATWSAAALRAELGPGAAARTGQGRLTLRTASGQELRLAPFSRISLARGGSADQPTRLTMEAGSAWIAVIPGSPLREQLEVETAVMTVVVRGGGVGIAVGRDGSALVRVYHGAAECVGPGAQRRWTQALADGQELSVSTAGEPGKMRKLDREKADADWVKSNEDQDLAGGYGGLPPEK